jgi:UDP-2,3-diacylglucosamine pyrophosphatase LpxH
VPGNHDEALREYAGASFGEIRVATDCVHLTADGRRFLVVHGDAFDQVTKYHRWLAVLGDHAYELVVRLNMLLSLVRRTLGVPGYWSLAGYAKRKVKTAVSFIFDFEDAVARYARERKVDGVICGHIHAAAIKQIDGVTYVNCGDWVDSCTAILEHEDGRLELVEWGAAPTLPAAASQEAAPAPRPVLEPLPQHAPLPARVPLPAPARLEAGPHKSRQTVDA